MGLPDWLQALLDWVAANPESAGLAIFIISAVESLALVGILIPGVLILFAFGTLVGAGVLPVVPVLLWAFAGAVLGDQISFWLGWNLKERLWKIWPLSRYPKLVGKCERFFHKYGAASVFIGRFIGPIRPVIPAMAGMSAMPPMKFTLVNLTSAALWSPAYLLPGAVLGASMQVAGAVAVKMAFLMIVVGALAYLWVWASSHFLIKVPTAIQGICITLFTTALIGVVLMLVLRSSGTQIACDQYESLPPKVNLSAQLYRQSGTGDAEALDIRFQGSLVELVERAGLVGLSIREPAQPADYLRWLLPDASLVEIPPRVELHCYHRSELIVQQLDDSQRSGWQLRLWQQEGHDDLWIGHVSQIGLDDFLGLITWPVETPLPADTVEWPQGFAPTQSGDNWAF